MSNLFSRSSSFTSYASQYIVPFIKASSEAITQVTYNSNVKDLVAYNSEMTHTELHLARSRHLPSYTPSCNLSQPRLFLSCRLNFILIWTTLITSYLANVWF